MCMFCKNLTLRVWGFIAIILCFTFMFIGRFENLFLISIVMPIITLPIWIITLNILRYGFKTSITPGIGFNAFSFAFWYALNLFLNIFAIIICSIGYLINLKKSKNFTPYLLRYAPATRATLCIFIIGKMSQTY